MNRMVLFVMSFVCLLAALVPNCIYAAENVAGDQVRELRLVGKVYVGEFESGSHVVTPEMRKQIMEGLSRAPEGKYSVSLYSYTDNSGSQKANEVLAVARAKAIRQALIDFVGQDVDIIDTQALVYKKKVNEVNGRFGIIEFWSDTAEEEDESTELPMNIQNLVEEINEDAVSMLVWQSSVEKRLERFETLVNTLHDESKNNANDVMSVKKDVASVKTWFVMVALVLIAMFCIAYYFLNGLRRSTTVTVPANQTPKKSSKSYNKIVGKPVENEETFIFARISDSLKYKVRCLLTRDEYGNCKITSPFFNRSGRAIVTETRKDMGDSLKGCMVNPEFAEQKEKLMAEKVIVKI